MLLPQIRTLGRRQQQRVPHHPSSQLHLQALLAADHAGNDDHLEEYISTGDANHYQSLIVQPMHTNGESGAKSATHIVSNKVCHQRTVVSHDH
jgi:hypothetical protein